MKRNIFIIGVITVAVASVAFVKPVQSFALDALSIFRVSNVKTIEISMADIQEGMQTFSQLKEDLKGQMFSHEPVINVVSEPKPEMKQLKAAEEFEAFKLRLPKAFESQNPKISAMDASEMKFIVNVDAANEMLTALKSPKKLSNKLNNVELNMKSSAAAFVQYDDMLFFATQKSYLDGPKAAKNELRDVMLNLPLIPSHLHSELSDIEENSTDIYLPVLQGFGREVDLGGKSGYIYTLSDLKSLTGNMPEGMKMNDSYKHQEVKKDASLPADHQAKVDEMNKKFIAKYGEAKFAALKEAHHKALKEMPNMDNASILLWTKDGNLYGLIGNKSDAKLSEIARSVR
ncbi:hypothetical protein QNH20_26695 [Neobacillus sp. WH10]|uniref:hypothetical protein n=1 Tax=Neobacillus sp. WH10 TaxID=3047873 RepID=UPI0024C12CFF|nr:hypothetical protein [Neobacillus sp. WH10]WHY77599.1 hypothetical protein QNH20_26695 [Neobacillus sp. WH10]